MSAHTNNPGTPAHSALHPPHMISLPMYFSSSPHSATSSAAASPSLSAYTDASPFSRPISHTTESSSSTATVSSTSSEVHMPRSMPPLRQRPSFDPLTLPSFVPVDFASARNITLDIPRSAFSKAGRPRSASHSHPEDYSYTPGTSRATSQPPSSPPTAHSEARFSTLGHSFASLSKKQTPARGLRTDHLSDEVRLEMSLFRD
ncbi:hypothetical protein K461DRAFT_275788 [Myriangium duriaei CBS 260.36]|uniref:Uncharacterized protein n=1 Tax=Myriangium duriaei CBS 260.36 TaxID=1168546 RepID=A0A9P4MHD9_9PEZI|nr:hypothetical protein K461DRAFT_275788 [Myriangium duriaei CBS 260.36]